MLALTSDLMIDLAAGDYQLEVWAVDSIGTPIYPSESTLHFQVNSSIE
ncbi:hypothetical protein [Lactiplantibacillus mudanjiangensis]|nr:hypothetical protein [Lactiplantibacillus mudanjiangensis]